MQRPGRSIAEPPLHVASAFVLVTADLLIFALDVYFGIEPFGPGVLALAIVGGALVVGVEGGVSSGPLTGALLKGVGAALAIALPGPVVATVIGLVLLAWNGVQAWRARHP